MFDLVFESLRRSILSGELPPGSVVHQEKLARELGVSRMPVREALRVLAREGLVEIRRNVGVRIVPLTLEDLEEVYLMRQALEQLAARLAAPLMTDEDLDALQQLLAKMAEHVSKVDSRRFLELDTKFHRKIAAVTRRTRLQRAIDELRDHGERYRWFVLMLSHRLEQSLDEHRAIFEACRRKDAAAAEQAMHYHIRRAIEAVKDHFQRHLNQQRPLARRET